ncbi:MAG: hypothetical protein ACOC5R_01760 [Elusimicrobiota bacterium]
MNKKAILLVSGGLDSILSGYKMKEQNVDIIGVYFKTPFTSKKNKDIIKSAEKKLGIRCNIKFLGQEYLNVISSPKYGYGKNMNPCIDCRIYMLSQAKKIMREQGADFIVTGEVIGQRPMSQKLNTIKLIEKKAGLEGKIVRPLSAGLMDSSIPEKNGWIDSEMFLSISGRSRKKQFKIAEKYGLKKGDYLSPSGGCRLTNKEYSDKLKDLLKFQNKPDLKQIDLLNKGRHFRISDNFKVIVGRDEKENKLLDEISDKKNVKMKAANFVGPLCIGDGRPGKRDLKVMAGICGRYSDCKKDGIIKFICYNKNIKKDYIKAEPLRPEKVMQYSVI